MENEYGVDAKRLQRALARAETIVAARGHGCSVADAETIAASLLALVSEVKLLRREAAREHPRTAVLDRDLGVAIERWVP